MSLFPVVKRTCRIRLPCTLSVWRGAPHGEQTLMIRHRNEMSTWSLQGTMGQGKTWTQRQEEWQPNTTKRPTRNVDIVNYDNLKKNWFGASRTLMIIFMHTHTHWPAQAAPWGTVIKWRLICPGLKWTSVKHISWFRLSVNLTGRERESCQIHTHTQLNGRGTEHVCVYTNLAGIITVMGTLNSGPLLGAAVS